MNALILGKGGREHALAKKMLLSPKVKKVFVCPGNVGMERDGFLCLSGDSNEQIAAHCKAEKIQMVIAGSEGYILNGIKEYLEKLNISCIAPSVKSAELETSKYFCKQVLESSSLKTAKYKVAADINQAKLILNEHDFTKPIVIKADGLAQGKGVWVCSNYTSAEQALMSLATQFGFPILFEECLVGEEFSAFALCDGENFVFLGTACDYKRVSPDPFSANTGGMGAYSPCDFLSADDEKEIQNVFLKTLKTMKSLDCEYQGFLFAGFMKTSDGLYVLEFNVRLGDPETQAILPRMKSDLLEICELALQKKLDKTICEFMPLKTVHVVLTSKGYPSSQMTLNQPIHFDYKNLENTDIIFSGVGRSGDFFVNSGGRVLGVTAVAPSKDQARLKAYEDIKKIQFNGMYYREDIGK